MRFWASGLLALLTLLGAGCKASPYGPFDSGFPVHVILRAEDLPQRGIRVRPVSTLGPLVFKADLTGLGGKRPAAAELATFSAATGKHRLSVWEPRVRQGARMTLKVESEVWVVMEMKPGVRVAKLKAYDEPPEFEWVPLAPVPD